MLLLKHTNTETVGTPLTETHNIYTKTPIKEMERNWKTIKQYEEILFEEYEGIAKITINQLFRKTDMQDFEGFTKRKQPSSS